MINIANFRFLYKLDISYASQDTFLEVIWSDRHRFGKKRSINNNIGYIL